MRLEVRNLLVGAGNYPWQNRVWEPNRLTASPGDNPSSVQKPYIIVREMTSTQGEDWGGGTNSFEVYVYSSLLSSYKDLETYEKLIVSILHRKTFTDADGTIEFVMYQGDIGPDLQEEDLERIGRGMSFTIFPLGWLNGVTYEPDPVAGLMLFTNNIMGQEQTITINGSPTGGTWSVNFNGQVSTDEQTITIGGAPIGGTFTITYSGQTTSPIAYNASPSTVQSALQLLTLLGTDVTVNGNTGGPWIIEFSGNFIGQSTQLFSINANSIQTALTKEVFVVKTRYGALPFNAYPSDLLTTLQGLSTVGTGNITVWGSQGGPYRLEFMGVLGGQEQPLLSVSPIFTGGISPSISVAVTRNAAYTNPSSWNPTDPKPAIYWRLVQASSRLQDWESWGSWMMGEFRAHVIVPGASARLTQIRELVEALIKANQTKLSNGSYLLFERVDADTRTDPMRDGQIRLQARWAIMKDSAQPYPVNNIQYLEYTDADDFIARFPTPNAPIESGTIVSP